MQEQAKNKCRDLSGKEKDEKRRISKKKYENMSEQEKQRLKEYEKPIGKQKNWHNKFYI